METTWLLSFLQLLSVQSLLSHSLQGLSCINSLIDSITCNWTSSEISPEVHCVLQGVLKRRFKNRECDLKPMEGQDHTLRSCQLVLSRFSRQDCVSIDVKCGNSVVASVAYNVTENVKMNPPGQPIINNFTVSWGFGEPHSSLIEFGVFELQFKLSDQPWQDAETHPVVGQMSVELPQNQLEVGRSYQVRVRVMPGEEEGLTGIWSSWSPIASWKSEVGKSPWKVLGSELWITLGLVATVAVLLLLISCRNHTGSWVYKLKFPHVPNPSTYFEALNSVHGGNLQKWLSPMFVPESVDVTQHFEDISPVVIFKADDITTLYKEHMKDAAEQWDSSSKNPGSCSIEVCPVYFSYKLGMGHTQEEEGFVGVKLEDVPLQTSYSYEQLGDLQGKSQHPDPGCGKGNEDQETEKEEAGEGKDVDGPREKDCVPPPTVLLFSLSGQMSPSPIPLRLHLPSFPQLPLPFHAFDSGTVPGNHVTSGPLEEALARSPFAEIKPSSGGYLSVQNAHVNNSI